MKEMRSGCFTLVANIFAPSLRNQSSKTVLEKQKLFIVKCEYNNLFFTVQFVKINNIIPILQDTGNFTDTFWLFPERFGHNFK